MFLSFEVRNTQLEARTTITYPFLDEGRALGHVPPNVSNEAVDAYLVVIARGFDDSPELVHAFAEKPELFDEVYDLLVYGLVSRE